MPRYVIGRTVEALNDAGRSVRGAKVLVLGLSYKPDIDDDRESPSFELIELLRERGADVSYCDPYIPVARRVRKFDLQMTSVPCTPEAFAAFDAVLLATPHKQFREASLYAGVTLLVDTRNAVPVAELSPATHVVRA
jgi:UDP-N-acetyl-D-glucosamine dehydrogenase